MLLTTHIFEGAFQMTCAMTALTRQKKRVSTRLKALKKAPKRTTVTLLIALFALGSVLFLLPACGSDEEVASTGTPQIEFPSFVYNSAQSLRAYETAVKIPEVLLLMPCYCNCGEAQEHKNLKDCFFKDDGSLNDHGAFCDICQMEVADISKWQEDGHSLKQIRALIDEKYPRYGEPTDTAPLS